MVFNESKSWTILSPLEQSIKNKIERLGKPLRDWDLSINYGIKTGLNEAFIIQGEVKDQLISKDPKSADLIRPILRGRDIKRYGYTFSDLWIINTHNGIKEKAIPRVEIEKYPAIKAHLDGFYSKLKKRADKGDTPYNLRNCAYMDEFLKQKIVYREISTAMDACLVEEGVFLNNKCYLITGDHLIYVLSFLNSRIFEKIVLPQVNITGGKGETFLSSISLITPPNQIEAKVEQLYNQRKAGSKDIDRAVDLIFCELYSLSDEEIKYIME